MNIAVVGSSGYIASFLIERFRQDENVEQILKVDQKSDADVMLDYWRTRVGKGEVFLTR